MPQRSCFCKGTEVTRDYKGNGMVAVGVSDSAERSALRKN